MPSADARDRAAVLVAAAVSLSLLVVVLPLTPRVGPVGRWGHAFSDMEGPIRIAIGTVLSVATLFAVPMMGLLFLRRGRQTVAAGVFAAMAAFTLQRCVTVPLFVGPRLQPFIEAFMLLVSSVGYVLAAVILVRAEANSGLEALPPPPRPPV